MRELEKRIAAAMRGAGLSVSVRDVSSMTLLGDRVSYTIIRGVSSDKSFIVSVHLYSGTGRARLHVSRHNAGHEYAEKMEDMGFVVAEDRGDVSATLNTDTSKIEAMVRKVLSST